MNSELKSLVLWVAYAAVLVVAFHGIHQYRTSEKKDEKTPPPRPVLSVTTNLADLDRDGELRIRFRLDTPAASKVEVPYRFNSTTAKLDRDFRLSSRSPLVIEPGGTEATLVLSAVKPDPSGGEDASKPGAVTVMLAEVSGVEIADGTRSSWEFPLTVRESIARYTVTILPPGDFQEKDARLKEELPVVFRLDRTPTDASISVRFRIGGDAGASDFEEVNPPSDGRIRFEPEQGGTSRLILRRLPGPRGKGDRKIVVECLPDPGGRVTLAPGGRGVVEVGISDPKSRLEWSVETPIAAPSGPDKPAIARLTVSIVPPSIEKVDFYYTMTIDPEIKAKRYLLTMKPSPDPWALDANVALFTHEIPPARLAFRGMGPASQKRRVRLQPDPQFSNPPTPLEFAVPDAKSQLLSGSVLVILLLTDKLSDAELRGIESILEQPGGKPMRDRLVNGTVFVLDADKELAPLDLATMKDRRRFPAGARIDEMLGAWSRTLCEEVRGRLTEENQLKAKRALLIRDIADQDTAAIVEGLSGGLRGSPWTIFWIAPSLDPKIKLKLTAALQEINFPLEIPAADLPRRLLEFLNDRPEP